MKKIKIGDVVKITYLTSGIFLCQNPKNRWCLSTCNFGKYVWSLITEFTLV